MSTSSSTTPNFNQDPTKEAFLLTLKLVVPAVVQAFIYGGYVILFWHCMHIFRKRQLKSRSHKIFLTGTVLLFVISTIQAILGVIPSNIIPGGMIFGARVTINILYIFANLIADFLFIYRCYIIWGCNPFILWIPLSLTVLNTGPGAYFALSGSTFGASYTVVAQIPLFISVGINLGLCALSAGHIWWVSRELKILGSHVCQKYNTAIVLIVESGVIYCMSIVGYVISLGRLVAIVNISVGPSDNLSYITIVEQTLFGILVQTVGIVPTLIVVRIGLGISAEDAQTTILLSRLQFNRIESVSAGGAIGSVGGTGSRDMKSLPEEREENDLPANYESKEGRN